ncbi:unnamed protein product, partial [marine sediment metagenome]
MSDLRRILRFISPYKKEIAFATVFLGMVVFADLSIPRFIQVIIDNGVAKQDMDVILQT